MAAIYFAASYMVYRLFKGNGITPLQGVASNRSPSLSVKVSDFSPAVINRGLGWGKTDYLFSVSTTLAALNASAVFAIGSHPSLGPLPSATMHNMSVKARR